MANSESHRLFVPANGTQQGPKLAHQKEQLIVDYDFEDDDGSIRWARILFQEVLSFEYRDSSCCRAEDLLPSTEIRSRADSEYLKTVTDCWHEFVGGQEWQQRKGGRGRFQHFTLYFDDACSLNIVASACEICQTPPRGD